MKCNQLYKHLNCIDVVFRPGSIVEKSEGLNIQGYWFNISTGKLMKIEFDNIMITKDEIQNWKEYEHEI